MEFLYSGWEPSPKSLESSEKPLNFETVFQTIPETLDKVSSLGIKILNETKKYFKGPLFDKTLEQTLAVRKPNSKA